MKALTLISLGAKGHVDGAKGLHPRACKAIILATSRANSVTVRPRAKVYNIKVVFLSEFLWLSFKKLPPGAFHGLWRPLEAATAFQRGMEDTWRPSTELFLAKLAKLAKGKAPKPSLSAPRGRSGPPEESPGQWDSPTASPMDMEDTLVALAALNRVKLVKKML